MAWTLIVFIYVLESCSRLSSARLNHNIAILYNGTENSFHNETGPSKLVKELNSQEDNDLTFNITFLNGINDSLTFYRTATTLYDFIEKHGLSLIISDNRHFSYSSIDILAGYLGIPMIKLFDDAGLSPVVQKTNTVLYLEPNPTSQLTVIIEVLQQYGWNRLAIVSDSDGNNLKMALRILATLQKKGKSELLFNLAIKNGRDCLTNLKIIKDLKLRAVVLLAQPNIASKILSNAKLGGLINVDCVWIMGITQSTLRGYISDELLGGIIELKLSGRREAIVSFDHFMEDSISLFRKALTYSGLTNASSKGILHYGCHGDDKDNFGKTLYKAMKRAQIDGHTGKIQFDTNGYRTKLKYDIIYRKIDQTTEAKSFVIGHYVNDSLNSYHKIWPPTFTPSKSPLPTFIRVSIYEQEPYAKVITDVLSQDDKCLVGLTCLGRDGKIHCCFGYCIDILRMLMDELGFSVRLHVVKDGKYGTMNRTTGQWSGLIGEIVRGEADMALADLTINPQRSKVVDFTQPFFDTGLAILVKVYRGRGKNNLTGFSEPFTALLWITILILIFVVFLCIWLLERFSPKGLRKRPKLFKELRYTFSFGEAVLYIWSTIFPSFGVDIRPKSSASRCVSASFAFCLLIIISTYTANLAAFLVVDDTFLPLSENGIRDPKLQNPPADFVIATIKDTNYEIFFQTANDPMYRRIWQHMRLHSVDNFTVATEQLVSGKITAFVADYSTLTYFASNRKECDFKVVGKPFFQAGFSIALTKNSSLTSKISQALIVYNEYRIASDLRKRWFDGNCRSNQNVERSSFSRLSIQGVYGLLLVIFAGVVLALIAFLVDHCVHKFWK